MRRVRFTKRAYVDGRVYEAGEEGHVGEQHFGEHIVDVATDHPTHDLPSAPPHSPTFIDHTGDVEQNTQSSPVFNPALAAQKAGEAKADAKPPQQAGTQSAPAPTPPQTPVTAVQQPPPNMAIVPPKASPSTEPPRAGE